MSKKPAKLKDLFEVVTPEGNPLTEEQVQAVAYTVFSRFLRRSHMPDYKSPFFDDTRKELEKGVKQVLEAIKLNGFKVTT